MGRIHFLLRSMLRTGLCCGLAGALNANAASAPPPASEALLVQAAERLAQGESAKAQRLLSGVKLASLTPAQRRTFDELSAATRRAAEQHRQAYQNYKLAESLLRSGDRAGARALYAKIASSPASGAECAALARARLARMEQPDGQTAGGAWRVDGLAGPGAPGINSATPAGLNPSTSTAELGQDPAADAERPIAAVIRALPPAESDPLPPRGRAKKLIADGMTALRQGDYQLAQDYFSVAFWYVPDAPAEQLFIEPQDPGVLQHLPVSAVHHVETVAAPRRHVTMNLEFGVGRVVGVNTFQFTGSPTSGTGASGFVQLPIISRTQLKTTATAPAGPIVPSGGRSYTMVRDYLVLIRPRL